MAAYSDHQACVLKETILAKTYEDRLKFVLRNYSCWYFVFTLSININNNKYIVYFLILYKPFTFLYKLSGVMMTLLILAGYAVTISNIIFTGKSKCKSTTIGKLSMVNAIVFLIVASIMMAFCHIIIWIPICKNGTGGAEKVVPGIDESRQQLNNQEVTQRLPETNKQ